MCFPASVILIITNQSCHHFGVIFWRCVLFLMVIYFKYLYFTSWHLRKIKSTLVIWHIVSKPYNRLNFIWSKTWRAIFRGNWWAQFKFPFLSILWSFLLSHGKVYSFPHFTVFCSSVCFPNNLNYCYQQMQGAYECVQLLTL